MCIKKSDHAAPVFLLFFSIFFSIVGTVQLSAQLVAVQSFQSRIADSIGIEKNWRTRNRIILAELEFTAGDTLTPHLLESALRKIWNLGNFSEVDYRWEDLPDGRLALILTARDAITIAPILSAWGAQNNGAFRVGVDDQNFLGRNIRLQGRVQLGTRDNFFESVLTLPRQILYRNMYLEGALRRDQNYLPFGPPMIDSLLVGLAVTRSARIRIGNPWHEDFRYVFSPDLELRWVQTAERTNINTYPGPDRITFYALSFMEATLHESIGTITHRRHQEEGYRVAGSMGVGLGLKNKGVNYLNFSLEGEYDRILTQKLQLSFWWRGFYCSSPYPSLWRIIEPREINSAILEAVAAPMGQILYAGVHYTWFNYAWLAFEQSVYLNIATLSEPYDRIPGWHRLYAIGTGFEFTIPMYPKASLRVCLSYSGPNAPWYFVEF